MKKQTQDLLQAELTNTLKRRKPVVINEPPKYEYPTYDNSNKTHDSSQSTANSTKPLNVSAVLSVVTGIKIPDVQYDSSVSAPKTQANDKPKITHGKPNFSIAPKETKPVVARQIKSPEIVANKLQRPSFFTNNLNDKSAKPDTPFEKSKSVFLVKSQQSINEAEPKAKKIQPKIEVNSKFEPKLYKEEFLRKNSVDDATSPSFSSVANKKALFEKPANQGKSIPKTMPLKTTQPKANDKFSTLNAHRIITAPQKPAITTVTLNKNITYGSLARRPSIDMVDHYERTDRTINGTNKIETKQFEQKTIVSFSKDLLNAPNNHPDQIRVKKTIITEHSHTMTDNPFNNIRFSIQTNGQVIPKPKWIKVNFCTSLFITLSVCVVFFK